MATKRGAIPNSKALERAYHAAANRQDESAEQAFALLLNSLNSPHVQVQTLACYYVDELVCDVKPNGDSVLDAEQLQMVKAATTGWSRREWTLHAHAAHLRSDLRIALDAMEARDDE